MKTIIFDTETTGFIEPQIVEAAWLVLDNSTENGAEKIDAVDSFVQRYKPSKPIELGAMSTHHIMDEDLIDCLPYSNFSLLEGTTYLIGHNIDYDWNVIGKPDVKRICTLALSRYLWPELDAHRQSAMLYHLERETARNRLQKAHSALCDVENNLILLRHIVAKLGGVLLWEQLWEISEKARIPTKLHFGKHRGMLISDVPKSYKQWLLGQPDVDVYLRQALEK